MDSSNDRSPGYMLIASNSMLFVLHNFACNIDITVGRCLSARIGYSTCRTDEVKKKCTSNSWPRRRGLSAEYVKVGAM